MVREAHLPLKVGRVVEDGPSGANDLKPSTGGAREDWDDTSPSTHRGLASPASTLGCTFWKAML